MKYIQLFIIVFILYSCKKETVTIQFSEINLLEKKETFVKINIPNAIGNNKSSKKINTVLTSFICDAMYLNAAKNKAKTIANSVAGFQEAYTNFKQIIPENLKNELPKWESVIYGEVMFNSPTLISVFLQAEINTGSPASNITTRFYNFNPKNGSLYTTSDLFNNINAFTKIAKKYYEKEIGSSFIHAENILNENPFKLTNNIGFNQEGVILYYNNFYSSDFQAKSLEFQIPYYIIGEYLHITI